MYIATELWVSNGATLQGLPPSSCKRLLLLDTTSMSGLLIPGIVGAHSDELKHPLTHEWGRTCEPKSGHGYCIRYSLFDSFSFFIMSHNYDCIKSMREMLACWLAGLWL